MFLIISPKKAYATRRLKHEAGLLSFAAEFVDVHAVAAKNFKVDTSRYSGLYVRQYYPFLNEIASLAQQFEQVGKVVVSRNTATGDLGSGKMPAYELLSQNEISVPQTQWLKKVTGGIAFPAIIKWTYGFAGKEVFLVRKQSDIDRISQQIPASELLLQEFIPAKYEYKVITVGFKSLPIVLRLPTNPKTLRPMFHKAEIFSVDEQPEVVAMAESASRLLGRELAKVDILEDDKNQKYILEVNRSPGFESFEKFSGYNVAKDFVTYLKSK